MPSPQERPLRAASRRCASAGRCSTTLVRTQQHYGAVKAGQQAGAVTYFALPVVLPDPGAGVLRGRLRLPGLPRRADNLVDGDRPGAARADRHRRQPAPAARHRGAPPATVGLLGLLGVLYAGLGWLSGMRDALVVVFELPRSATAQLRASASSATWSRWPSSASRCWSRGRLRRRDRVLHGRSSTWLGARPRAGAGWSRSLDRGARPGRQHAALLRAVPAARRPAHAGPGAVAGRPARRARLRGPQAALEASLAATQGQPAFQAFGIALILLVWINYFSRVVMYAAAWAYTSRAARAQRVPSSRAGPVQGPPSPACRGARPAAPTGTPARRRRSSPGAPSALRPVGAAAPYDRGGRA